MRMTGGEKRRNNGIRISHRNNFYLFLCNDIAKSSTSQTTTLLATTPNTAQLWEIAWIARRPEPMYRVSDRGQLRVETRWTHSKIDLTPEACSLEAGGENDWRWETAPTVGRGKPSLAAFPLLDTWRARQDTLLVCVARSDIRWRRRVQRAPILERRNARTYPPVVIRSLHAAYPRVTMPTKFLFSPSCPDFNFIQRSYIVEGEEASFFSIVSNFRQIAIRFARGDEHAIYEKEETLTTYLRTSSAIFLPPASYDSIFVSSAFDNWLSLPTPPLLSLRVLKFRHIVV